MATKNDVKRLETLGRTRLSENFFIRDFLYSEISNACGIPNIPDDPDLAVAAGKRLCQELLEPLHRTFGRIAIRSAYRSCAVNAYGNEHKLDCASNESNYGAHIWDRRDSKSRMGAMACIVIPWFINNHDTDNTTEWQRLAWWIHDHLPYSSMTFFSNLAAFNLGWKEEPTRVIESSRSFMTESGPKRVLTKPGMDNWAGSHASEYEGFPQLVA